MRLFLTLPVSNSLFPLWGPERFGTGQNAYFSVSITMDPLPFHGTRHHFSNPSASGTKTQTGNQRGGAKTLRTADWSRSATKGTTELKHNSKHSPVYSFLTEWDVFFIIITW